ncbi:acyl-CoA thioesterase [Rhodococcus sp. CH91]|uniref:acyl-CoA thioesterase n=1 Tax=Rhodococcus sp. CH91 TaxID=2910256 RepID=UPI001F4B56BE|nr:acyl-CoA thioesterase [Rhodococcus sp. CH91]
MTEADGKRVFTCSVEVRWGDSDRLGHVNNAKIVEYMQEARIKFFRGHLPARSAVAVRKMDVEFLRPIKDSSAPLAIEVSVLHVGTTSFTIRHTIADKGGAVCAFGDAVLVGFDPATDTARRLGDDERAVLDGFRALTPG